MTHARTILGICVALAGCGDDNSSDDRTEEENPSTAGDGDGDGDAVPSRPDASTPISDAGTGPRDAGSAVVDASTPSDAGPRPVEDAGPRADAGDTEPDGSASAAPTFRQAYAILSANCSPCHTSENDGSLDMSSRVLAYGNLVEQDAEGTACRGGGRVRVVPGDAQASLLVQKLEGTQDCGARMPRGRTPLPEASIDLIKAWIEAGAAND
jgi:hypothetical protein